jgi:hypothetical protein
MKDDLKKGIQSDYGGLNGTNLVTQAWNIVMLQVIKLKNHQSAGNTLYMKYLISLFPAIPPEFLKHLGNF